MKSKVLIAGASGMVGRALVNELEKNKNIKLLKPTRDEVNYLNYTTDGSTPIVPIRVAE